MKEKIEKKRIDSQLKVLALQGKVFNIKILE